MPIRVRCSCGQIYDLPDNMAGKKARCQSCRKVFQVPTATGGSQPTPPAQARPKAQPNPQVKANPAPRGNPQSPVNPVQPAQPQQQFQQQPLQPMQQPLQAPMDPAGLPAYQTPAYPAQGFKKKQSAGNNKAVLWGSVGGGVVVIIVVLLIVFSRGGDNPGTDESTQQASNNNTEDGSTTTNENSGNTSSSSAGSGNQPVSNFNSLPFAKSENGLCKLIAYEKFPGYNVTTNASSNGTYFSMCDVKLKNPPESTINLFPRDNPDQKESRVLTGDYKVKAISNDGRYLALQSKERSEIYDWKQKKILRVLNVIKFTTDSKYAIIIGEIDRKSFTAAYEMANDRIVWASDNQAANAFAGDLSYQIIKNFDDSLSKVDLATGESKKIVSVERDRKIAGSYYLGPHANFALYRKGPKLAGYDLAKDGEKVLEMTLGVGSSNTYVELSANQSIAAITAREKKNGDDGQICILDLNTQKVIDRISLIPFRFSLSDDGTTLSCNVGIRDKAHLAIWKLDHGVKGKRPVSEQPYFAKLSDEQKIPASLQAKVATLNGDSAQTAATKGPAEVWSNAVAEVVKAVPAGIDSDASQFFLSANGNRVAMGAQAEYSSDSPVYLWDKNFLANQIANRGGLLGISADGNLVAYKQILGGKPMQNDRIQIWNQLEEKIVFDRTGPGFGYRVEFAPDSKSFLIVKDGQVQEYGISNSAPISPGSNWAQSINAVSRDFKKLAELTEDGVKIYDIPGRKLIDEVKTRIEIMPERGWISFESNRILMKSSGELELVDLTNGKRFEYLLPPQISMRGLKMSTDGSTALFGYNKGELNHYLLLRLSDSGIKLIGEMKTPPGSRFRNFELSHDGTEAFAQVTGVEVKRRRAYLVWWKIKSPK